MSRRMRLSRFLDRVTLRLRHSWTSSRRRKRERRLRREQRRLLLLHQMLEEQDLLVDRLLFQEPQPQELTSQSLQFQPLTEQMQPLLTEELERAQFNPSPGLTEHPLPPVSQWMRKPEPENPDLDRILGLSPPQP